MRLWSRVKRLEGLPSRKRKVCGNCGPGNKVTFVVPPPRIFGEPHVPVVFPGCTPEGLCIECGERRVFNGKATGAAKFEAVM